MSSPAFPPFESLPEEAQKRIATLAERFQITPQQAVVASMLLSRKIPIAEIAASCSEAGVPLSVANLQAMRATMDDWVSLEERRKAILGTLEEKGLLTDERRARILAAATSREVMAVYYEAVPLEPIERRSNAPDHQHSWALDPLDLLWLGTMTTRSGSFFGFLFDGVAEGLSSAADAVMDGAGHLFSSIWD